MGNSQTGTPGCCVLVPLPFLPVVQDPYRRKERRHSSYPRQCSAARWVQPPAPRTLFAEYSIWFTPPAHSSVHSVGKTMGQSATINADAMAARRTPNSIAGCGLDLSHSLRARLVRAQARRRHCLHRSHGQQESISMLPVIASLSVSGVGVGA